MEVILLNRSGFEYNEGLEQHRVKIIRRIFFSQTSGFGVFAANFPTRGERMVVAGSLVGVEEGDRLDILGEEVAHPRFGRQFKVHAFSHYLPNDLDGLKAFLSSGRFPGVGEKTVQKLIDGFGRELPAILDKEPERLGEIKGISRRVADTIAETYRALHAQRELLIKLAPLGIGQDVIQRLLAVYDTKAMTVIGSNPYRIMGEVKGIGFKTADLIGRAMGFEKAHPLRVQSALLWLVEQAEQQRGDMYMTQRDLFIKARQLFDLPPETLTEHLQILVSRAVLLGVEKPERGFVRPLCYWAEKAIADRLCQIMKQGTERNWLHDSALGADSEKSQLTKEQVWAVDLAFKEPVQIITGGPGTGKTTIIREIVRRCLRMDLTVAVSAPTGRAAKRIEEASGYAASTIHRLLKINPDSGSFVHHENNPLDLDMVIVDEFSMVDAFLFAALVKAIKGGSHLVLIGDRDQLPSVGPGNVIRDLMASGFLPMTVLSHNFRQEDSASLNGMAVLICQGQDERFMRSMEDAPQQFLFHLSESEEEAQRFVLAEMERLLERTGISSLDYQVLSPMYRGAAGVEELNRLIQARFNQRELLLELPGRSFRLGDRVMQLRNNYQLEIFNGEQGIVKGYDGQRRLLKVEFADRQVELSRDQMEELVLSYATTVHKAQGAEFQEVILCLLSSHGVMLNRELFYTAMTRARRRVVLVGSQRAVHLAIRQAMPRFRKTLLPERLREGFAHIHPKLDEGCGHASKK